jgi:transposase
METNSKKQRQHFYRDYASGQWSMSEVCDRYQISRPTGYKWIDRIEIEGLKAVEDRSRAPIAIRTERPNTSNARSWCFERSTAGEPPRFARS